MYGKIENGQIKYPPKHLQEDGRYVANYDQHTEDLIADGWLEIIENEPEIREGYNAVPQYEKRKGKIYQTWTYEKEEE